MLQRPVLGGGWADPYSVGRRLVTVLAFLVVIAMILPAFFVIPVSFSATRFLIFPPEELSLRWYQAYFNIPEWTRATVYSVVLGVLTTATTLALGIPAAFGLVRGRFRGQRLLTLLFVAPLIIPVILIAMSEYFFLADLNLIGTTLGLVIAHTVFALPFAIIIIVATLRGFNQSYELASMSLGANPLLTFWHVTLPLIRPGVVSAALLAFLASFNEFLISLFVIGATRSTLPIQFWKGLRFETNPTIAAVASMLIVLSVLTLILVELTRWQNRRRQERDYGIVQQEGQD
jgi:putative spermidine/putrescine transport system permease protein